MTSACAHVRRDLGAFVDGELTGAKRLGVSQHLSTCGECADAHRTMQILGEVLRGSVRFGAPRVDLTGLADGVISRVRAEQAQSWRAMFDRAVEDWHWALVGAGSVAAACVSLLFVSVICWLGPKAEAEDSLAAMLNNLGTPAGTLLIMATPVGSDQNPMLMQFDSGEAGAPAGEAAVVPAGFAGPSRDDLVIALSEAMVNSDGRMRDLGSMSRLDRRRAEGFLHELELERRRSVPLAASWSGRRVSIQKLGLVTNTSVTGKAL